MKTYTARYDGVPFEFDISDDATVLEIKTEVNRILKNPDMLISACKRAYLKKEEQAIKEIEFWKSQAKFYEELCLRFSDEIDNQSDLITKLFEKV